MSEVVTSTPARVLAVYAHPDDLEVSCGGSLRRWSQEGSEVSVVICAQGDKGSHDPSTDPTELARVRRGEAAAAADQLGISRPTLLGYPDGEIENTLELREQLVDTIRSQRPQVIVCPDPTATFFGSTYVNHRDHRMVGWSVLDAAAPAAASPLYFPQAGPAHQTDEVWLTGTLEPDTWVDIGDHLDHKVAAVRCHTTQLAGESPEAVDALIRARAAEAGQQVGLRFAEGFRRIHLVGLA